jgi:uncharacterized protein
VEPPRWLADEMVGRLARYLRFVGCDTLYVRGLDDDEILRRAEQEGRVVLTRDRALAARARRALLLTSPHLADQWQSVRAAYPEVPSEVRFDRCSDCNGQLERYFPPPEEPRDPRVPWARVAQGLALFRCIECGHLYWEGSHTARIRAQLEKWKAEAPT